MSIEPTCQFCGLVDKSRCTSMEASEDCPHAPVEGKAPVVATGPLKGLLRQHYGAILVDPPWQFLTRSDKGKGRSPENHYECMTLDDIKALPVADLAAKDCALFMWVIDTHWAMALDVMESWGFAHKTRAFEWVKLNKGFDGYPDDDKSAISDKAYFKGMGYWTRANPESCILGTRGSPTRKSKSVRRLIVTKLREHSRKPDEVYPSIEALVPGPYVELFSRSSRPGWDAMGNEVGKFDDRGEDAFVAQAIEELI